MKIVIASDHGGFELKDKIFTRFNDTYDITDLGNHKFDKDDDYPDYAALVGQAISSGKADKGILICGSGVGACVAVNKIKGVRGSVCHDIYSAHQGVEHDDMNVLCLGARIIGVELANELAAAFFKAQFINQGRFKRRLEKVLAIENKI